MTMLELPPKIYKVYIKNTSFLKFANIFWCKPSLALEQGKHLLEGKVSQSIEALCQALLCIKSMSQKTT